MTPKIKIRLRWIVPILLCAPLLTLPSHARQTKAEIKAAAKRAIKAFAKRGVKAAGQGSGQIGTLNDPRITESSGLAASRRNPGILYTHNDSGDGPFLFAIDRSGKTIARYQLQGAENVDWEDIAVGSAGAEGRTSGRTAIYLADTGNNHLDRQAMTIYHVEEPLVVARAAPQESQLGRVEKFQFRYPDRAHDCETLMVHPKTGEVIVVTKEADGNSEVFSIGLRTGSIVTARKIADLKFHNFIFSGDDKYARGERQATGGDISSDGKLLVIRTYLWGYQWHLTPGQSIAQTLATAPLRFMMPLAKQGESICYRHDNQAILCGSEGTNSPLFEMAVP